MKYTDNELQQEQWRQIDGYDGLYEVSDFGRVRSLKFGKTRVLRSYKDKDGYLKVNLWKDGKRKPFSVHRLVASTFIHNDDESKNQVNHKDENKQNNRASNLEWCTAQYNSTYNDIHHRHITKRTKVKDLYRPDLSIAQNIELFRSNGVKCSERTILNLRKDLGLTKHYRPRKKTTKTITHTY